MQAGGLGTVQSASHNRDQKSRARRLARGVRDDDMRRALRAIAEDFDKTAEDLVEVRHPSRLPQRHA
jgi:hypothetical protein